MLWIKSLHILFVMAWMAGVFYLPRILVHYIEGVAAGEDTRRLVTMADKLFRFSSLMALLTIAIPRFWPRFWPAERRRPRSGPLGGSGHSPPGRFSACWRRWRRASPGREPIATTSSIT